MKIGVIALGIVGETIYSALKFYHKEVVAYDKFKPSNSFEEIMESDVVFIALPTNLKGNRLDSSIIRETLKELEKRRYTGVAVVKSTLSLNFVKEIEESTLRIVVMPEFLHARSRLQDFVRPDLVVIAGDEEDVDIVMKGAFYWLEKDIPVFHVSYLTAVMAKLVMNAFAATKISFANEVRRICSCLEINPKLVMNILTSDRRASPEYTDPTKGPFEGKCLPKDLEELINCSDKSILLKAVREVNEIVRKDRAKERERLVSIDDTA